MYIALATYSCRDSRGIGGYDVLRTAFPFNPRCRGTDAINAHIAAMGRYRGDILIEMPFSERKRHEGSRGSSRKRHDITVNAMLPSIIDTPANRADMPDAAFGQWVQPSPLPTSSLPSPALTRGG